VAYTELIYAKTIFQTRMLAVQQYAGGRSIHGIELETGVNRRQLYRWLDELSFNMTTDVSMGIED